MNGATLESLRRRIEILADEAGRYELVCGRTGERPVPADGLRFATYERARAAARATERYRAALRRYDPRAPRYDVIVRERDADEAPDRVDGTAARSAAGGRLGGRDGAEHTDERIRR
jgi:hypothetical protein